MDIQKLAQSYGQNAGGPGRSGGANLSAHAPLMSVEDRNSSTLLLDSSDRFSGTPFNFTADLQSSLQRVRFIRLRDVVMPKLNNVHNGNNQFRIKHDLGTTGLITLTPGFYNTTTLANELTLQINAQFVIDGIADTVTTSFDPTLRAFSIQSVGGNNFFIIDDDQSTLIKFGEHLAPFQSEIEANVPSSTIVYSGIAAMLPTRYLIIVSSALTRYSFSRSIISSRTSQIGNIVGILDIGDLFSANDFDVGSPYNGVYRKAVVTGDHISVVNTQDTLERFVDVQILDGYKRDISGFYTLAAPYPSTETLSVVINFEVGF